MQISLNEDTRTQLIARSRIGKKEKDGKTRYEKRMKCRLANTVREYNKISMEDLFRNNLLNVSVPVVGETDNYLVKISFGGFLDTLREELERRNNNLDLATITKALVISFNKDDVYISCNCADWVFRFQYYATREQINSGSPQSIPSNTTNPKNDLGAACKHVLLVLNNTSWIIKVASVIKNYVEYMSKHYERLYADVIYPAIYGKEYEEPVQLTIDTDNTLSSEENEIDTANIEARKKGQFQKGNTSGIRFAPKDKQISINDLDLEGE